jgi:16S rRNA (guanine527-N7)-methyltransferase
VQIREKLARRAFKAGLTLPEVAFEGLTAYFELLQKWNRRVSLTALPVGEAGEEAIDRLLIEPALAAKHVPDGAKVIDIGSGGGSPAIPLKIVVPSISMHMVESKTRKVAFLRDAGRQLRLSDIKIHSARYEELLASPDLRESCDVLTLRAVKVDAKTLGLLQSFLRRGGSIFLFTSNSKIVNVQVPQLTVGANHVLLPALGSRLQVFAKTG